MTRKIKDITPWLESHFMDTEIDSASFEYYEKLVTDNALRFGLYNKYFGLLQDSWIIKTTLTENKFSVTLNDFTTHVFADVIVAKKKLKINDDKLVFPIQLEFEMTSVSFNTVDEDGNIHNIEPTNIDEYLYEQIISVEKDIIEIALIVWKNGIENNPGQEILVLINAKSITLKENQDNAWKEIFGNTYDNYYNYFKQQLAIGKYLSDYSICEELYDEYEKQFNHFN